MNACKEFTSADDNFVFILIIFDSNNFLRNIDIFHLLIGFCILTVRNLIVSIKYGYYRKEDYDILSSDPPYWDQSRTERRMVLAGWSSPEKYPGLIEDELTCTVVHQIFQYRECHLF